MYVVDMIHAADFEKYLQHYRSQKGSAAIIQTLSTQRVPTTSKSYMGIEIDALTRCKAIVALVVQSYSFCAGNRESKPCRFVEQSRQTEAALWACFAPSPSAERTAVRRGNRKREALK
jgi:hypothetical protein